MKNKISFTLVITLFILIFMACGTAPTLAPTATPDVCQTVWDTEIAESLTSLPTESPLLNDIISYDLAYDLIMGADCSAATDSKTCLILQGCLKSGWRPVQDTRSVSPIASVRPSTPSLTSSPALGFSRSNPAPLGTSVTLDKETIKINDLIDPADDLVDPYSAKMYPLGENQEYIAVGISIECNKSQDETCMGVDFSYSIVGSSGNLLKDTVIQVLDKCIECDTVFGGGTLNGYVVFVVDKDETGLVLVAESQSGTVYLLVRP
jgi:hypothetical protein